MNEPTREEVLDYLGERSKWDPAYSDDVMDQHGKMASAALALIQSGDDMKRIAWGLAKCVGHNGGGAFSFRRNSHPMIAWDGGSQPHWELRGRDYKTINLGKDYLPVLTDEARDILDAAIKEAGAK